MKRILSPFLAIILAATASANDAGTVLRFNVSATAVPLFDLQEAPAKNVLSQIAAIHLRSKPHRPFRFRFVTDPTKLPGFIPLVVPSPKSNETPPSDRLFTARVSNIPLNELLVFFAHSIECNVVVREGEVLLYPDTGTVEPLVTRTYKGTPPPGVERIPPAPEGQPKMDIRSQLAAKGVRFFEGGLADFYPDEKRLVIRTSQTELFDFEMLLPNQ